jgi:hypothetical protein
MYYDVHSTRVHQQVYRPSSNLSRFARYILSIILSGRSPIVQHPSYVRRAK